MVSELALTDVFKDIRKVSELGLPLRVNAEDGVEVMSVMVVQTSSRS